MKKVLCVILLFCLFTVSLFAETQMRIVSAKDDFGDETGQKFLQLITTDFVYSNSATSNEEGYFVQFSIFKDIEGIACYIVPYSWGASVEHFLDDKISLAFKAGTDKSKQMTINSSDDSFTFAVFNNNYNTLIDTLKKNSKVQFVVKGTKYEKDTKYSFTFNYDNAEFNKLWNQF